MKSVLGGTPLNSWRNPQVPRRKLESVSSITQFWESRYEPRCVIEIKYIGQPWLLTSAPTWVTQQSFRHNPKSRKGKNMNFAKRVLMFVGFVILAAALVSVLAPKATHALVATLVQVANTSANPVPNSSVDEPARHVWTGTCHFTATNQNIAYCSVPASSNEEVVVQEESYYAISDPTNTFALFTAGVLLSSGFGGNFLAFAQSADNGLHQPTGSNYFYTAAATIYLDPGSQLLCSAETKGLNSNVALGGDCYFSGYYVTLP